MPRGQNHSAGSADLQPAGQLWESRRVGFGMLLCTVGSQCRREGKECFTQSTQGAPTTALGPTNGVGRHPRHSFPSRLVIDCGAKSVPKPTAPHASSARLPLPSLSPNLPSVFLPRQPEVLARHEGTRAKSIRNLTRGGEAVRFSPGWPFEEKKMDSARGVQRGLVGAAGLVVLGAEARGQAALVTRPLCYTILRRNALKPSALFGALFGAWFGLSGLGIFGRIVIRIRPRHLGIDRLSPSVESFAKRLGQIGHLLGKIVLLRQVVL